VAQYLATDEISIGDYVLSAASWRRWSSSMLWYACCPASSVPPNQCGRVAHHRATGISQYTRPAVYGAGRYHWYCYRVITPKLPVAPQTGPAAHVAARPELLSKDAYVSKTGS